MLPRKDGVAFERAFDKISSHSGFGPGDEYLLLESEAGTAHANDDANTIAEFSANGRRWLRELKTGGPVHALAAADLNGDGVDELLAGSDDEHLYALDARLSPMWSYKPPFVIDSQTPGFCTLGKSKVRKLRAQDLNGDGLPEILAGVGNMRLDTALGAQRATVGSQPHPPDPILHLAAARNEQPACGRL